MNKRRPHGGWFVVAVPEIYPWLRRPHYTHEATVDRYMVGATTGRWWVHYFNNQGQWESGEAFPSKKAAQAGAKNLRAKILRLEAKWYEESR